MREMLAQLPPIVAALDDAPDPWTTRHSRAFRYEPARV
jgi:hypothetical protein